MKTKTDNRFDSLKKPKPFIMPPSIKHPIITHTKRMKEEQKTTGQSHEDTISIFSYPERVHPSPVCHDNGFFVFLHKRIHHPILTPKFVLFFLPLFTKTRSLFFPLTSFIVCRQEQEWSPRADESSCPIGQTRSVLLVEGLVW